MVVNVDSKGGYACVGTEDIKDISVLSLNVAVNLKLLLKIKSQKFPFGSSKPLLRLLMSPFVSNVLICVIACCSII